MAPKPFYTTLFIMRKGQSAKFVHVVPYSEAVAYAEQGLTEKSLVIGSGDDADIKVDDDDMANLHMRVYCGIRTPYVVVVDLGNGNGTWIDGKILIREKKKTFNANGTLTCNPAGQTTYTVSMLPFSTEISDSVVIEDNNLLLGLNFPFADDEAHVEQGLSPGDIAQKEDHFLEGLSTLFSEVDEDGDLGNEFFRTLICLQLLSFLFFDDVDANMEEGLAPGETDDEANVEEGLAPGETDDEAHVEEGLAPGETDDEANVEEEEGLAPGETDDEANVEEGLAPGETDDEACGRGFGTWRN